MATLLFQKVFSGAVDNTSVGVFEREKKKIQINYWGLEERHRKIRIF